MGSYAVSVEKEMQFRGKAELVSNVYHYRITSPVASDYQNLADAVVAKDRLVHPSGFTYKTVRVFGPTDQGKAANQMRLVQDLTGPGTMSPLGGSAYRELAYVVGIYVGRSPVHNRKVFVRKFIHVTSLKESGDDATSGLVSNASKTFFQNWFNGCKTVTSGGVSFDMVTPRDRLVPAAESAVCLNYLRIRQLKQ